MRSLLGILFLGFLAHGAFCTTIIGARTDSEVVISADSKRQNVLEGQFIGDTAVCKLLSINGILIAVSGHTVIGDFSVRDFVMAQLSGNGPPETRVTDFHNKLVTQLLRTLTNLKKQKPAVFARDFRDGPVLGLVLAYWDQTTPVLEFDRYEMKIEDEKVVRAGVSLQSQLTRCPGTCKEPPGVPHFIAAGSNLEPLRGILLNPKPTLPSDLPPLLQQMVETKIQTDPDNVGGPISTVILDRTGPHWYQAQHGVCAVELKR